MGYTYYTGLVGIVHLVKLDRICYLSCRSRYQYSTSLILPASAVERGTVGDGDLVNWNGLGSSFFF